MFFLFYGFLRAVAGEFFSARRHADWLLGLVSCTATLIATLRRKLGPQIPVMTFSVVNKCSKLLFGLE